MITPGLDVDAVVRATVSLEPLPATVARLTAVLADPTSDAGDVVEAIAFDEALTANLLRRANSAPAAGRTRTTTVADAVVRLGSGAVLAMAVGQGVGGRMRRALPQYGLAEGELWEHSVAATLAAEALRGATAVPVPPEAATAALLHDIGKLVLARFLGPSLGTVLRSARERTGTSGVEAERRVLRVDHGELGGKVAAAWGLPELIATAVAEHHAPTSASGPTVWAVVLADLLATQVRDPSAPSGAAHLVAADGLGLDEARWASLAEAVAERHARVLATYG